MTPPSNDARIHDLLAHAGWIRALCRELARDPDLAADVEQRTWIAALRGGPRAGVPIGSWLAAVARNALRQERRAERRRAEHEQDAARPEALPSTEDVVARAAVQRELVAAVMDLDEPYRTTILLRFYEGHAPREVARRMDVPVDTVRTRTARGIARLRERLDGAHGGDRASWMASLAPWVSITNGSAHIGGQLGGSKLAAIGWGWMNTKLKVVVALCVAAGIATYVWTRPSAHVDATTAAETRPATELADPRDAGIGLSTERAGDAARTVPVEPRAADRAAVLDATARSERIVHGKVIDEHGRPLAGVRVGAARPRQDGPARPGRSDATVRPGEQEDPIGSAAPATLAVSTADGTYSFAAGGFRGEIVSVDREWTTVLSGTVSGGEETRQHVLVLARPRALIGSVVDELGTAIAAAHIEVVLPSSFRTRFVEVLDSSTATMNAADTDEHGGFAFTELPALANAEVHVRGTGYLPWEAKLGDLAARTVITLVAPREADGAVRGKVVDPSGTPVPKARVAFGLDTTRTDDQGAFAFPLDDSRSFARRFGVAPDALQALQRGYLPARFVPPEVDGRPVWPAFVTLRLGATPLEIQGRVIGIDDRPLAGAEVWIMDATLFGAEEHGPLHVENLLAGQEEARWRRVETAADGTFTLDGLLDRDYHVEAMDPNTLLRVQVGPITPGPAGTVDVDLRLPKDGLFPRVAGRVVSHSGAPIAGAHVFPMCDGFRTRMHGEIVSTSHEALDGAVTDSAGRFELSNMPRELAYLRIDGDGLLPLEFCRVGDGDDRFVSDHVSRLPAEQIEELVIEVELRCHVQIALDDPTIADEVAILDGKGREIELNVYDGHGRETHRRFPITDGRSPAFAVSDSANTVVLFKNGAEVTRIAVALVPGPLKEIRF